jgi:hypothetical protein
MVMPLVCVPVPYLLPTAVPYDAAPNPSHLPEGALELWHFTATTR